MKELAVRFKRGINPDQWRHLHLTVREMFEFMAFGFDALGYDLEITSMIRPKTTDSGIHATGRALDCVPRRRTDTQAKLSYEQCKSVERFVRFFYRRTDGKVSCLYHDAGTGNHFHLQCDRSGDWQDLRGEIPEPSARASGVSEDIQDDDEQQPDADE